MAGTVSIVYAIIVVLIAIIGFAYVLTQSDDGTGKETRWSDWGTIAAVALFLVAMVWTTMF